MIGSLTFSGFGSNIMDIGISMFIVVMFEVEDRGRKE